MTGLGFFTIFQAALNYLVDTFQRYAASAVAANSKSSHSKCAISHTKQVRSLFEIVFCRSVSGAISSFSALH
jgi:hypothetical protein